MRGRLSIMLMVLAALALTLSLVAAVASNASAQDSAIPNDGQGNWVRHSVPTTPDRLETADSDDVVLGVANPRYCAITLAYGGTGQTSGESFSSDIAMFVNGYGPHPRWLCNNLCPP